VAGHPDRTLTRELVREGDHVVEAEVTLFDSESDHPWRPFLSMEDAKKLDEARLALRRGDLVAAARLGRVYELVPVSHA
jgi:hypothetical protein